MRRSFTLTLAPDLYRFVDQHRADNHCSTIQESVCALLWERAGASPQEGSDRAARDGVMMRYRRWMMIKISLFLRDLAEQAKNELEDV